MNKKGQTLILFVILLPILLVLFAVIVDTGYIISKKIHYKEVIKEVVEESKEEEKIKKLLIKNQVDITDLEIIYQNNEIKIKKDFLIKSIFGSIVGIKNYTIKIDVVCEI